MAYNKRPHVPYIPIIPSPWTKYIIGKDQSGQRTLTRQPTFFTFNRKAGTPLPLEGAAPTPKQGFIQGLINSGDIVVSTPSGTSMTCERILGVTGFIDAVRGNHPDVQPEKQWWSDYTAHPLQINFPSMPQRLLDVFQQRSSAIPTWTVNKGDRVKEGEVIGRYNINWSGINTGDVDADTLSGAIRMPHDGIILSTSAVESHESLFSFQLITPPKGRRPEHIQHDFENSADSIAHDAYDRTTRAVYLMLEASGEGEHKDWNDLINNEMRNFTASTSPIAPGTGTMG